MGGTETSVTDHYRTPDHSVGQSFLAVFEQRKESKLLVPTFCVVSGVSSVSQCIVSDKELPVLSSPKKTNILQQAPNDLLHAPNDKVGVMVRLGLLGWARVGVRVWVRVSVSVGAG